MLACGMATPDGANGSAGHCGLKVSQSAPSARSSTVEYQVNGSVPTIMQIVYRTPGSDTVVNRVYHEVLVTTFPRLTWPDKHDCKLRFYAIASTVSPTREQQQEFEVLGKHGNAQNPNKSLQHE